MHLSDFACEKLAQDKIGHQHKGQGQDRELVVSAEQLCQYLAKAESMNQSLERVKQPIAPGIIKRKRSETPPEEITSSDETWYTQQEERAAKRVTGNDPDYVA